MSDLLRYQVHFCAGDMYDSLRPHNCAALHPILHERCAFDTYFCLQMGPWYNTTRTVRTMHFPLSIGSFLFDWPRHGLADFERPPEEPIIVYLLFYSQDTQRHFSRSLFSPTFAYVQLSSPNETENSPPHSQQIFLSRKETCFQWFSFVSLPNPDKLINRPMISIKIV
jgi:hypothetical protein